METTESIEQEVPKRGKFEVIKKETFRKLTQLGSEVVAFHFLLGAEIVRFVNVNEAGIERYSSLHPGWKPTEISQPWLSVLQTSGDIFPSFFVSMATYWALFAGESSFKRNIPEKVKVAISVMAGIGATFAHEGGMFMLQNYSTGNLPDAVVGSVGAVAFGGLHTLLDRFINDSGKDIRRLEKEISMDKEVSQGREGGIGLRSG